MLKNTLSNLEILESEAIHIIREVAAQADNPVMLYSVGKDSAVMLHLAKKAFYPGNPPFPLLHVDTTWKFRDMYELRDKSAQKANMDLLVFQNPEALKKRINPFDHGEMHTEMWKTEGLKLALDLHKFDAAFGGARRDEEKSRSKERIFSFRSNNHQWEPKSQRPELWSVYNARKKTSESMRVFPLSNWTELDIWHYIYQQNIEIVPLYFAKKRPVVKRDELLIVVDDDRFKFKKNEKSEIKSVRFRTLGCYPLTGAVESNASNLIDVIQELLSSTKSERQGRAIDHNQSSSMEQKKTSRLFLMGGGDEKDIANNRETLKYLDKHLKKSLLRFITCGSVDDGKSTLLGRLLYDTKTIFSDQFSQLQADSKKFGTQGGSIDYALLLDSLAAEQEQGITIDVAYRFFSTEKRKFIVADTPGHEQYTRNMATGASTADAAVILIDARKGLFAQTKRHSYLCHLFGIKHFIVAINKMDLVSYNEVRFHEIAKEYEAFASTIGIEHPSYIPISGIHGDNIVSLSENMKWYKGSSLLELLEDIDLADKTIRSQPFRMPVQLVNRPNSDFRGISGKVASGYISKNDEISIFPSGKKTKVKEIISPNGSIDKSLPGQSITLTFKDEIDCSRGNIISSVKSPLEISDQFEATIVWMDEKPFVPGRVYNLKIGCLELQASCAQPKYKINTETNEHIATKNLELNDIGKVVLTAAHEIPFTSYRENRDLGGFILIDKVSNITVAAGLINFALRRSQNIHWQTTDVTKSQRAAALGQKPIIFWMTGLSGSGKSTIANSVERQLTQRGFNTFLLDGDNIRHGLNKDLGFTEADRIENIRRIGEVSKLMTDAGLIVITAFISPFKSERSMVREMVDEGEFVEIFIDTPLEVAEKRDVKGLYAKARAGELKNFTGIDSPYENPSKPEIVINTQEISIDEAADLIVKYYLDSINR